MTDTHFAAARRAGEHLQPVVLIVNSDDPTRAWIEAVVLSTGLRAISVSAASELASRLEPEAPACAILDVGSPEASGLDLQEALARAGVSILFLTRNYSISACARAFKAGAVDFMTLPCDPAQFVRALQNAIREALSLWTQHARSNELRSKYERLTAREREVFALVSRGLLNKQIAERLNISEITVQIHRGRVMRKMSARSIVSLVRMADALTIQPQPVVELPEAPARSASYELVQHLDHPSITLHARSRSSIPCRSR